MLRRDFVRAVTSFCLAPRLLLSQEAKAPLPAGTVAAFGLAGRSAFALPLGLPLGIQLYSVRQQMAQDFEGALAGVAAAGFTEVEAAALPKRPAKEIRAALDRAGLRCVSAHCAFSDFHDRFDETVEFNKTLGVSNLICPGPGLRPGSGAHREATIDDWHYNAEQFNLWGEKLGGLGLGFGYHNHKGEFASIEGKTPYMELLRLTDAKKVTFELDCGWAMAAGVNPVDIMKNHPYRISMLHIKDFVLAKDARPGHQEEKVTELGKGTIDYRPIYAQAAKTQHITHAFVEQEAFDMPWKDSLKVDGEYLRGLKA